MKPNEPNSLYLVRVKADATFDKIPIELKRKDEKYFIKDNIEFYGEEDMTYREDDYGVVTINFTSFDRTRAVAFIKGLESASTVIAKMISSTMARGIHLSGRANFRIGDVMYKEPDSEAYKEGEDYYIEYGYGSEGMCKYSEGTVEYNDWMRGYRNAEGNSYS